MKRIIGLPADGPELEDPLSSHFGHCNYFVGVELTDDGEMKKAFALKNDGHSSCMEPVMNMKNQDVTDMVLGGIGGRPFMGFIQVGINVFQGIQGSLKENVATFLKGGLRALSAPSCGSHSEQAHSH